MKFEKYHEIGTPTQTAEALDLLEYEIHWLVAHPFRIGPQNLECLKKSTTIYLRCRKWGRPSLRPDPLWTFDLIVEMLEKLRSVISERGMREVEWRVVNGNVEKAGCGIWLQHPVTNVT